MKTGRVLSWNVTKRYGWIRPDDGPKDFFAHVAELIDVTELRRGMLVTFSPVSTPRGGRALEIRVLEPVPAESGR